MARRDFWKTVGLGFVATASLTYSGVASAKTLGFVLTNWHYSGQFTPDNKIECPDGLAYGHRDNFRAQFKTKEEQDAHIDKFADIEWTFRGPNGESDIYVPQMVEDSLPYREGQGKVSYGFNLDGTKNGQATNRTCAHAKFTSPEGEPAIDNQIYQTMACVKGMRPGGDSDGMANTQLISKVVNRIVIEITGVDDEANDDQVEVTIAHGLDKVLQGPTGGFIPHLSQRMDEKAKDFIFHAKAKIVNGILTTDVMPSLEVVQMSGPGEWGVRAFKDARLKITLAGDHAKAVVGGYHDVERYYRYWAKTVGQHAITSNSSPASFYRSLHRNADGYKDPVTGKCTAISASYDWELTKAFIVHETPEEKDISANVLSDTPADVPADVKVALVTEAQ